MRLKGIDSAGNQYITKEPDWVEREGEGEGKIYVAQKSFSFFLNFLIYFINFSHRIVLYVRRDLSEVI